MAMGENRGAVNGPGVLLCCVTVFIGLIQSRIIAGTYGPVKESNEHGQTGDIDVSGENVLKYSLPKGSDACTETRSFPRGNGRLLCGPLRCFL